MLWVIGFAFIHANYVLQHGVETKKCFGVILASHLKFDDIAD
jgi:hypothetical protein